jgi:hypothetical protein
MILTHIYAKLLDRFSASDIEHVHERNVKVHPISNMAHAVIKAHLEWLGLAASANMRKGSQSSVYPIKYATPPTLRAVTAILAQPC